MNKDLMNVRTWDLETLKRVYSVDISEMTRNEILMELKRRGEEGK